MLEEEMKQLHLPDETDAYSNNFQDCLNKKKCSGLRVKKKCCMGPSINDVTHLGRRKICQKLLLLHKPI